MFERLSAEMAAEGLGVVDLDKARAERRPTTTTLADDTDPDTDDGDDEPPVFVDRPAPPLPLPVGTRRRILPAWLLSKAELKTQLTYAAHLAGHTTAYHAVRTPLYVGKLAARSPRGAARTMTFLGRWTSDAEGQPLRAAAARREDAELYLKLCRQRDNRVRLRSLISLLASVFGLAAVVVLWVMTSTATLLVLASAVVLALGVAGAPVDEPLITRAVVKAKAPKLTSDMVIRALESLGIGGITSAKSKGSGITFPAPIMRDGPGWRADVELPHGVEVADVMGRRGQLASGLRRPLGTVWPEQAPGEHPGRMVLWVGDQDMATAKQPAWPLARKGTVDLFDPIAFATDQRGNWVSVTLMFIAGIIGAVPRMGKTFLLRLLLLIAALDPRAELHTYDLKGTGDLDPVGDKVSHRHRAGDDEEDIEYAIADLRELREELRRRTKVIRSLPRDICPESKVTSKLADTKSLRLHPIMVGVDECQVWFEHPKYGAEFEEICTDLVKRGPATGIVLLLATQRPDAKSLPTGISANAILRLCLKVMGQVENDMVLGTSAYKRGVRATTFTRADRGIAYYIGGEGADAQIIRSVFVDAPAAEAIAQRGREAREQAGLLSGHAAGGQDTAPASAAPAHDLLADILAVVGPDEPKLWSETVVARLGELRPDAYGAWAGLEGRGKADQLVTALKPYGIATGQVWGTAEDGKGANRRGITRADILKSVTERDKKRDAG
ncbi:cell division protein FtsK [Kitasatospora purpeofusca]|uniref:cell division protein FtsK n=1 Tax=Kitasatospora purpeofusca TaxID=67352 RepID=UPI00224C9A51|nr:cell division protein FtsK [Kitasatospora purpeofusca]MCX4754294.1 cell division protein FtsK [Kitasatospora purpeofusca]WSR37333.1 cell division protein FtsK [Kitasatospora purpeofusca]